jgi:hypothetical protein
VTLNTLSLHCLFFSPLVGGDLDDSPVISSLLLSTSKVHEGDSSHHRIGPLPIRFVLPLLRHDNSIVFNLVFSFLSFFYIASRFLWSRYSYDRSVKCLSILSWFKRDQYSTVASYFFLNLNDSLQASRFTNIQSNQLKNHMTPMMSYGGWTRPSRLLQYKINN